jgi:predicted methyltransferase
MRVICRIALAALAVAVSPGLPQVAKTANENYQTPSGRESLAKGLIGPDRDTTERPNDLLREIGVQPGMTVADVGPGVRP